MRFGGLTALFAAAIGFVFAACGDGGEDGQGTVHVHDVGREHHPRLRPEVECVVRHVGRDEEAIPACRTRVGRSSIIIFTVPARR